MLQNYKTSFKIKIIFTLRFGFRIKLIKINKLAIYLNNNFF